MGRRMPDSRDNPSTGNVDWTAIEAVIDKRIERNRRQRQNKLRNWLMVLVPAATAVVGWAVGHQAFHLVRRPMLDPLSHSPTSLLQMRDPTAPIPPWMKCRRSRISKNPSKFDWRGSV